jgi:hypothetical protein
MDEPGSPLKTALRGLKRDFRLEYETSKDHPQDKSPPLVRVLDTGTARYLPPLYRQDTICTFHNEYGHMAWPNLQGLLEHRYW